MTKHKLIPAEEVFKRWRKSSDYVAAFDLLEDEFATAAALVAARAHAGLTQTELAKRMGTTQSAIARMEGGKARPSTTTLRKIAAATGTRLKMVFEAR